MYQPLSVLRRVATASVGFAVASLALLAAATPAVADTTVPLNPAHVGATAAGFQQDCDDLSPAAGQDGWHFVVPSNEKFVSLDLTFSVPNQGVLQIHLPGGSGSIGTPPHENHAYVYTPAGAILQAGTSQIAGDVKVDKFNLSHTCPGTPTQSPSPSPSESPSQSPSESPSASASTPGSTVSAKPGAQNLTGKGGSKLPTTGVAVTGAIAAALALVGAGVAMSLLARRRSADI